TSASSANYFDARWSWTGNNFHKMRYLSVVAHLRRSFGYIMTVWSDSDGSHWNHIHIDNYYRPFGLLMSGSSSWAKHSDTTLVQNACNLLNGESLVVDGVWGS